jgi:two-component system, response regulator, stage 0 sporulation protein F
MSCNAFSTSILLVEDDPLPAATMKRYLSRISTDVRIAETAEQAVREWMSNPPGLVLMDYRLPDGFGTAVIAGQREKGFNEPVICMTGEAEMISEETRQTLDIHAVLGKPVMLNLLREAVLELFSAEDSIRSPEQKSNEKVRRIGKFRVVRLRERLTGQGIARLSKAARNETWIALDVSNVGEVDPAVCRDLCALSGWFSAKGGRLYLVAHPEAQRARIQALVGSYIEVLSHTERLKVEGVRLTGTLERKALLTALRNPEAGTEHHE